MPDKVQIAAGDVIDVQLTSETVVMQGHGGRRILDAGHITNRMRLFVRDADGKEDSFDFEESELPVRDGQRVAIVQGKFPRVEEPVPLILFNLSTDEREVFETALNAFLGRRPAFGPRWKAFGFSVLLAAIFFLISHLIIRNGRDAITSASFAIMFAFLGFPLLWWLCGLWDSISERIRYAKARKIFIADMEGRVRAYARAPHPA